MALLATVRRELRARYGNQFDADENRMTRYGVLNAVMEDNASPQTILDPDIVAKAMISEGTDLKIPVFNKGNVTLKNVRSCTIYPYQNTTALVDVVWVTLVADFDMIPAQYLNQQDRGGAFETWQEAYSYNMNKKMVEVVRAFNQELEDTLFAFMDANKSTVTNSSLVGAGAKYSEVGGVIQVPLADQPLFWNDAKVIMQQDDFYGPWKVLGNTALQSSVNQYINQGGGNAENTNFQFADYMFRFSNHITNGAGVNAAGFIYESGKIGMLNRVSADHLMGHRSNDAEWYTDSLAAWGLPASIEVGVLEKSNCDDVSTATSNAALTASKHDYYQFSFDAAYLISYNSDPLTQPGVLKKFEFLNT